MQSFKYPQFLTSIREPIVIFIQPSDAVNVIKPLLTRTYLIDDGREDVRGVLDEDEERGVAGEETGLDERVLDTQPSSHSLYTSHRQQAAGDRLKDPKTVIFKSNIHSVPARLGKGQGARENGHNLARERPKFEHSLERERPSRAHFYARTPKIWAQSSTRRNKNWAQFCGRSMKTWAQICKNGTVHQLFEDTKTDIMYKKKFIQAQRYVNRTGRKTVRAGHKTVRAPDSKGRAQDSKGARQ